MGGRLEDILPGGSSDSPGGAPLNNFAEEERLRKKKEREAQEAEQRERDLAPIKKALREEVDFLGKKYTLNSKTGGRGLF